MARSQPQAVVCLVERARPVLVLVSLVNNPSSSNSNSRKLVPQVDCSATSVNHSPPQRACSAARRLSRLSKAPLAVVVFLADWDSLLCSNPNSNSNNCNLVSRRPSTKTHTETTPSLRTVVKSLKLARSPRSRRSPLLLHHLTVSPPRPTSLRSTNFVASRLPSMCLRALADPVALFLSAPLVVRACSTLPLLPTGIRV